MEINCRICVGLYAKTALHRFQFEYAQTEALSTRLREKLHARCGNDENPTRKKKYLQSNCVVLHMDIVQICTILCWNMNGRAIQTYIAKKSHAQTNKWSGKNVIIYTVYTYLYYSSLFYIPPPHSVYPFVTIQIPLLWQAQANKDALVSNEVDNACVSVLWARMSAFICAIQQCPSTTVRWVPQSDGLLQIFQFRTPAVEENQWLFANAIISAILITFV